MRRLAVQLAALSLLSWASGCGEIIVPGISPDGALGADSVLSKCTTNADCTSVHTCIQAVCDTSSGQCITSIAQDACFIDGSCYQEGQEKPGDRCLYCDPASQLQFTLTSCPTGSACEPKSGTCVDQAVEPVPDVPTPPDAQPDIPEVGPPEVGPPDTGPDPGPEIEDTVEPVDSGHDVFDPGPGDLGQPDVPSDIPQPPDAGTDASTGLTLPTAVGVWSGGGTVQSTNFKLKVSVGVAQSPATQSSTYKVRLGIVGLAQEANP